MRERTDHPPSPEASTRNANATARRAVVGGVAGGALLVGPVALANAIVPKDDAAGSATVEAADAQQSTSLVALRQKTKQQSIADTARSDALQSVRTTTTPPPPPPTTTTTVPPTTTTTAPPPTTTAPPTTEAPAPPPTEAPAPPPPSSGGFGDPNNYATWDALAECEASGNWHINTGNGYYGGLQFSLSSWQGVGGQGYPHENSREVQIQMGQRLQASSGWGAWPHCSSELGLR
jgi:Transglycosylase-like domain